MQGWSGVVMDVTATGTLKKLPKLQKLFLFHSTDEGKLIRTILDATTCVKRFR